MPEFIIPPASACAIYRPGHSVHWIQVRHAVIDEGLTKPVNGEILSIDGQVITVALGDELVNFRNHEAARLALIVDAFGPAVTVQQRWDLMKVRGYCFCISLDTGIPLEPCISPSDLPEPDTIEAFVERTMKYGGANLNIGRIAGD